MEKETNERVPPEMWMHILTFIDDFQDMIVLKFVSKLFYTALLPRDPLVVLANRLPLITTEVRQYFKTLDKSYIVPRAVIELTEQANKTTEQFKLSIIGAEKVGKSQFVRSCTSQKFSDDYIPTVAAAFVGKFMERPDVKSSLHLWDIGGDIKYFPFTSMYIRGMHGTLICFAVDDEDGFVRMLSQFVPLVAAQKDPRIVIYILGLKSDIKERKISELEAKALAYLFGIKYFEVSAKDFDKTAKILAELNDDLLRLHKNK